VILDDETTENLASVSPDNSTLTFDSSTSTLETLQQGDVVVIDVTDETPYGLLQKVISITQEGDQVVVETTQAKLTDVIEQGSISVNKTLTTNDINTSSANTVTRKGVFLRAQPKVKNARAAAAVGIDPDNELFNLDLDGVVLFDHDGDENTTYDQIVVDGEISFGLSFDLEIEIKWFNIKSLTFTTTPWLTAEICLSSSISKSIEKKVLLREFYMAPTTVVVPIPVPPFTLPFVIVPVVTLYLGLDGEASVGITAGITKSASLTAGVEYKDSEWGPVSDFEIEFDYQPLEISASGSAKAYVEPDLALLIYGVVGPYSTLRGYLQLDADINDEPWWSLYAGIVVGAGVEVEVIGYEIVDFEIPNIIDYQQLLTQANISPTATITSPSDGGTYIEWDTITFSGTGEDAEDGTLTGSSLVWTSDIDGQVDTGTSFSSSTLSAGTQTITLTATDIDGASGSDSVNITINPISDTSPPSVPTGLTATAISSSHIDLSWTASTDDVGIEGYNIYRDGVYLKSITTTLASDTGLNSGTQYCYTISAYDAEGNESGQSGQACETVNPIYAASVGFPVFDEDPNDSLSWDVPWNYFGHYYPEMGGYHPGEDWNLVGGSTIADLGKPVHSIADGTIEKVSNLNNLGYLVVIEHIGNFTIPGKSAIENGQSYSYPSENVSKIYSVYLHINNIPSYITKNQYVQRGQIVGYIMNPGGGPHLHFEIRCPDSTHSTNWSMVGNSSNWAIVNGSYTGYYLNLQGMVDAGLRNPRDFINANSTSDINPTLSVSPSSGSQGTTFVYSGSNYTPNGTVEWHVKKPDGTEYPPADLSGKVDSNGNFSHSYLSHCENQVGIYTIWAIDKFTGKSSTTVTETITESSSCLSVQYEAHFANTGWMGYWAQDGATAGTPGGNQMEAIKIQTTSYETTYRAHVALDGWLSWVSDGVVAGTTGQGKSLQAIEIKLVNAPSNFHVSYRVYVEGQGWQGWKSDGITAGTTGLGLGIQAIEIKIQSW